MTFTVPTEADTMSEAFAGCYFCLRPASLCGYLVRGSRAAICPGCAIIAVRRVSEMETDTVLKWRDEQRRAAVPPSLEGTDTGVVDG